MGRDGQPRGGEGVGRRRVDGVKGERITEGNEEEGRRVWRTDP